MIWHRTNIRRNYRTKEDRPLVPKKVASTASPKRLSRRIVDGPTTKTLPQSISNWSCGTAIATGVAPGMLYRLGLGILVPVNKRVARGPSTNPIYSIRRYLAVVAIIELIEAARFDDGDGDR